MNRRQAELVFVWVTILIGLAFVWWGISTLVVRHANMDWLFGAGLVMLIVSVVLFVREMRLFQREVRGTVDTTRRRR